MSTPKGPQKHVPMRTCIATGNKLPKKEMIRIVRIEDKQSGDVEVQVDPSGKLRGRGANLEMNLDSFDLAIKKSAIERALKLEKRLKPSQVADLREQFQQAIELRKFRVGNKRVAIKVSRQEFETKLSS